MGFGKPPSNREQTDMSISTDTIVDRIISELGYSGISRVSSDNIAKYYDIDKKLISEATVYISDSADSCFEVSCFKLNDEADYSKVEYKIKIILTRKVLISKGLILKKVRCLMILK